MINYDSGKIYKIVSSYTDMIYIGSTTKKYLSSRMVKHRSALRRWMDGRDVKFFSSFSILLHGDARIVLIENYPCSSKDELRAREQYYINLYSNIIVNCYNACTNEIEYKKQYYKDNQEYFKQYRIDNRQKYKQYYKDNQEKIKQYKNQKIECECGSTYTRTSKARHEKTQKHQNYVFNI